MKLLQAWHTETLERWPLDRLDHLPRGLVHGDWHGRNMVFVQDRIAAVFDFDDMNHGFLAEDVAFGVRMFGRERPGSLHIRSNAAQTFLAAYEEQRALYTTERAAIALFLTIPRPPILTWALMIERPGLDPVDLLKADVARLVTFRSDLPRIREIVGCAGRPL